MMNRYWYELYICELIAIFMRKRHCGYEATYVCWLLHVFSQHVVEHIDERTYRSLVT